MPETLKFLVKKKKYLYTPPLYCSVTCILCKKKKGCGVFLLIYIDFFFYNHEPNALNALEVMALYIYIYMYVKIYVQCICR